MLFLCFCFCLKVVEEMIDSQQKLYEWREEFFHDKFKHTAYINDRVTTWVTDGGDDSHFFDTIPYQICCNFDTLATLASTKRTLAPKEYYFFENNEILSGMAKNCFDQGMRKVLEEDGELKKWDEENPGIP